MKKTEDEGAEGANTERRTPNTERKTEDADPKKGEDGDRHGANRPEVVS